MDAGYMMNALPSHSRHWTRCDYKSEHCTHQKKKKKKKEEINWEELAGRELKNSQWGDEFSSFAIFIEDIGMEQGSTYDGELFD